MCKPKQPKNNKTFQQNKFCTPTKQKQTTHTHTYIYIYTHTHTHTHKAVAFN